MPVEYLELLHVADADTAGALPAFRILRILRLVRLLRLLKIDMYMTRLEEKLEVNLRALRVVELTLQIIFIAHLLACGWFATTWMATPEADEPRWIDIYEDGEAADGPTSKQYLFSFYWSLTMLTALNPIPPTTDTERFYTLWVNLLNRLLFAYIVGKIGSLVAALDKQAALVQEKIDILKEYLFWRGTPKELAIRVKRYRSSSTRKPLLSYSPSHSYPPSHPPRCF